MGSGRKDNGVHSWFAVCPYCGVDYHICNFNRRRSFILGEGYLDAHTESCQKRTPKERAEYRIKMEQHR